MPIQNVKSYINHRVGFLVPRDDNVKAFLHYRKTGNPVLSIQERLNCSVANAKIILENNEKLAAQLNKINNERLRFFIGSDGRIHSVFYDKKTSSIFRQIVSDGLLKKLIEKLRSL